MWPKDHHGLVAADDLVRAFCILNETPYGLVVEELWEEPSRVGYYGLGLLSRAIEAIGQDLANQRGVSLAVGGLVRLEQDRHIAALRKRGYTDVAVVLQKVFEPQ